MRFLSMPIVASTLLASASLAGPALAQGAGGSSAGAQQGDQTPAPMQSHKAAHRSTHEMEQQLRQSLEKSGFKDIHIRPAAFLVHAQSSDGSHMVMMISPDEVQEVIQSGSTAPNHSNGATGSMPSHEQSTGPSGTQSR